MAEPIRIGVIGGSGFYKLEGLRVLEEKTLRTPFGDPSASYIIGELEGKRIAFLARHGEGHLYSPSLVNYRANIYGFKMLGVETLFSFSAVGSLQPEFKPGDFVLADQFFDRTKKRADTYFDENVVAHITFDQPVCSDLRGMVYQAAEGLAITVHNKGTYVCMEGPAFSTLAESLFYQKQGFSVIGMTNLTEAKLAREAEICYTTIAMVTDYDCWHNEVEPVSVEMVVRVLKNNTANAHALLKRILVMLDPASVADCACRHALQYAVISDLTRISAHKREQLGLLIKNYLPA
ncbi:MAG: S-methyl-5'-thioadenosine phosphorylase [Candidatus Delongbacteria bacterium]|nr:S-methyl-5'-thioadenosine phosphorylase [Candidatus Delongbacteria bacterium]